MADPWAPYLELSRDKQESPSVMPVLHRLLSALQTGVEPPPETRRRLLAAILSSLSSSFLLTSSTTLLTPLATLLKFLGRSPAGSEELGRESAVRTLIALGGLPRVATVPRRSRARREERERREEVAPDDSDDDDVVEGEPDLLLPHESEGLRCLANTLMLHPSARDVFPDVLNSDPDRLALRGMVRILGCDGAGFLGGRLLFLLTSKPGVLITELAEGRDTVKAMEEFALRYLRDLQDPHIAGSLSAGPPPTPDDTLREHLKMAYNLMLQYGRQPPPAPPVPEGLSDPFASSSNADSSFEKSDPEEEAELEDKFDVGEPAEEISPSKEHRPSFKKRFWGSMSSNKGEVPSSDDSSTSDTPSAFDPTSDPSSPIIERRRSKSPRYFAKKLVGAVTGGSSPSSSKASSPSTSPNSSHSVPRRDNSSSAEGLNSGTLTLDGARYVLPLFQPYLRLSCLLPLGPDPKDPSSLVRGALNTLLNYPVELEELDDGFVHSWLQPVPGWSDITDPTSYCSRRGAPVLAPLVSRLMEILAKTCDAWFPTDVVPPQSSSSKKKNGTKPLTPAHPDELIPKGMGESSKVEEILGPIMLLMRKVSLLAEPAAMMKEILLPEDIDRSVPLERRVDLTGHLVRLLSSLLLPNTAYGVGEFLYNLCDRDPATLSTQIGYGNASGFLQSRGELIPPPPIANANTSKRRPSAFLRPSSTASNLSTTSTSTVTSNATTTASTAGPRAINPITGAFEVPPDSDEEEMTEEEKEREAEKLYVLFDRMTRTGVMEVDNPVRKARAEGRFAETTDEAEAERKRLQAEDERIEREVEEEMAVFKSRKRAQAQKEERIVAE